MMRNQSIVALFINLLLLLRSHEMNSFTVLPSSGSIVNNNFYYYHSTTTKSRIRNEHYPLHAKKTLSKNKKSDDMSSNAPVGFGSKPYLSKSSPSSGENNKVRSVSGHRGSGEKPLRQAANTFDAIRKEHGKDCTYDVYCRSPLNDKETFWFVGKVSVRPDTVATPEQAILSQKRVILEYAKHELRPQNLAGKYSKGLELWYAPGDTEMDAVQNKIHLKKVDGSTADLHVDFSVKDVGYNPEIYVGDEVKNGGLRIKRDDNGEPVKPIFEVNQSL
jgi:hypothetical protein